MRAEKPRRLFASIWSEAVVKGGAGLRVPGVFETSLTRWSAFWSCSRKARASSSVSKSWLSFASKPKLPEILKVDLLANFSMACSRSTIRRSAGLCTRPAEMAPGTFLRTMPDKSKPTSISKVWRACWLATISISTVRGVLIAASSADLVIS